VTCCLEPTPVHCKCALALPNSLIQTLFALDAKDKRTSFIAFSFAPLSTRCTRDLLDFLSLFYNIPSPTYWDILFNTSIPSHIALPWQLPESINLIPFSGP